VLIIYQISIKIDSALAAANLVVEQLAGGRCKNRWRTNLDRPARRRADCQAVFGKQGVRLGGAERISVGGALTPYYKVGTGNAATEEIQVSIGSASVSDLYAGLAADTLRVVGAASAAKSNIGDAQSVLGVIQGPLAGDTRRVAAAAHGALSAAAKLKRAGLCLTTSSVSVDLSQIISVKTAEDAGLQPHDGAAADRLRDLLVDLEKGSG